MSFRKQEACYSAEGTNKYPIQIVYYLFSTCCVQGETCPAYNLLGETPHHHEAGCSELAHLLALGERELGRHAGGRRPPGRWGHSRTQKLVRARPRVGTKEPEFVISGKITGLSSWLDVGGGS